jgi:enoyl-CoA hydratase/carnithine racemase
VYLLAAFEIPSILEFAVLRRLEGNDVGEALARFLGEAHTGWRGVKRYMGSGTRCRTHGNPSTRESVGGASVPDRSRSRSIAIVTGDGRVPGDRPGEAAVSPSEPGGSTARVALDSTSRVRQWGRRVMSGPSVTAGMSDTIEIESSEGVTTITVTRPDRLNALDTETLQALEAALRDARDTHDTRALVLTGAGEDAFVAGADIEYMSELSVEEAQAYAELGHRVTDAIETFPAPAIAAVNGYAFGGGCELALAADLRVASERAVIGQTEVGLGIVPGWGGTQRLSRIVGDEQARRLVFFAERIDAQDAHAYGLVGEVVAHDELDDRVSEMAAELAAQPAFALRSAKEALNQVHESHLTAGLRYERRLWSGLFGTADQREGMTAFVEERDPDFR